MYQIHIKKECSQCHEVDNTEIITRYDTTYLRCRNCGHEKMLYRTFTNIPFREQFKQLEMPKIPDKELF